MVCKIECCGSGGLERVKQSLDAKIAITVVGSDSKVYNFVPKSKTSRLTWNGSVNDRDASLQLDLIEEAYWLKVG